MADAVLQHPRQRRGDQASGTAYGRGAKNDHRLLSVSTGARYGAENAG